MHDALHFEAHTPQPLQLFLSILILNSAYLLRKPSSVPTGQIVLQYERPCFYVTEPVISNVASATIKASGLTTATSVR